MCLKRELLTRAGRLGIEYAGVCDALPDSGLFELLEKSRRRFGATPYTEGDISRRVDPRVLLGNAKSVFVCLFPYYKKENIPENLALYAAVTDYHAVVKEKLRALTDGLCGRFVAACDTAPLSDRYLAYKAGLGFFGKNHMLINEKYGSFFMIGSVVTDVFMPPDKPLNSSCAGCGLCQSSCPGGALLSDGGFDFNRCVSYISQAKSITGKQRKIYAESPMLVGCDVCQRVCPHNRDLPDTPLTEFHENFISRLDGAEIAGLSNKEFMRKYGKFAFSWLGKRRICEKMSEKNINF